MIVVHNRDQPEIYDNPLIEHTVMGLMVHLGKFQEELPSEFANKTSEKHGNFCK